MKRDAETLESAAGLFDAGFGYKLVAARLGIPRNTALRWEYAVRALGKEALLVTTRRKYSHELKVQAARDVVDAGMAKAEVMARHGIASLSPLERWTRSYREGGPDALLPKPKGRPRKPESPAYAIREEELEARVRELELELEIQKRIEAFADGRKPR